MTEEKLRTVKEIKDEIERMKEILQDEPQASLTTKMYIKGKMSGLYFALHIKTNFDGEVME